MQIFLQKDATRQYHLKEDTDKEYVWVLRPIDSLTMMYLSEISQNIKDKDAGKTQSMINFLKHGLKACHKKNGDGSYATENLLSVQEEDIPFLGKRMVVSVESLSTLSVQVLSELLEQVLQDNIVTDEERKN